MTKAAKQIARGFALVVALGFSQSAFATPELRLIASHIDNTGAVIIDDQVSIVDGDTADKNTATGFVTFAGDIGKLNVKLNLEQFNSSTTGKTPMPGLGAFSMDVNSISVTNYGGAGMLTILFSETGFEIPANYASRLKAGGTQSAGTSIQYTAYAGSTNVQFDQSSQIGTLAFTAPSNMTEDLEYKGRTAHALPGSSAGLYSLTQELKFNFSKAGSISGDFSLQAVPEPASISMLGGVLLMACGVIRRKLRRS